MARVWIGNFKGAKGDQGDKGDVGPQGPRGEQGPMGLVNGEAAIEFEDYEAEGIEVPEPDTALAEIASGKSLKGVISNIKAFLKGVRYATGILYNLGTKEEPNYSDLQTVIQALNVKMEGIMNHMQLPLVPQSPLAAYQMPIKKDDAISFPYLYVPATAYNNFPVITAGGINFVILGKGDKTNPLNAKPNTLHTLNNISLELNSNNEIICANALNTGVYYDGTDTYYVLQKSNVNANTHSLILGPMILFMNTRPAEK